MHFESGLPSLSSSSSVLQHHRALEIKNEYRAEKAAFQPVSPLATAAGHHTTPPPFKEDSSSTPSGSTTTPQSRPLPAFFGESASFSTKRERETPKQLQDLNPPRPPIKSCPPISRIRPQRRHEHDGARPVSFKNNLANLVKLDNHKKTTWSSLTNFCHQNEHLPAVADPLIAPTTSADLTSNFYDDSKHDLYFEQCFIIEGSLGCGSFGKVYKVKSKEDGLLYAVKKSREKFKGHSDRSRKLEEVAKHEQLPPHPNCVKFYRAWEEKQRLYIQTELCQMSLSSYADQYHDIPEETIWQFLVDLLLALKHLHDRQLVHMDIKPDNVFISFDGYCKLGDFGLVVDLKKPEDVREVQEGDPRYLAPEVLNGHIYVSTAADVFSLGMTILELATDLDLPRGDAPWHQLREGAECTRSHIPARILDKLSDELLQIIFRMLEPDYTKRASVDELLNHPKVKKLLATRQRVAFLTRFRSFLTDNQVVKWISSKWSLTRMYAWQLWRSVLRGCVKCGQCLVLVFAWLQKKCISAFSGGRRSSSAGKIMGGGTNSRKLSTGYRRLSLIKDRRSSDANSEQEDYMDKQNTSTPKKDDSMNLIQLSMIHIDEYDDDEEHRVYYNDSLNEKNNSYTNKHGHLNDDNLTSSSSMSDQSDCYSSKKLWPNKTKEEIAVDGENKQSKKLVHKSKSSYINRAKEPITTPLSFMRQRLLFDEDDDDDDNDEKEEKKKKQIGPTECLQANCSDSLDELPKITNRSKLTDRHHHDKLISTPQSFITSTSVLADKHHLVKRHNLSTELDLSVVLSTPEKRD